MNKIEDLSFPHLVNIIQGEEIKAADVINSIALESESLSPEIEKAEKVLNNLKIRKSMLLDASFKVVKHLKKELPLAVQRDGYIVVISERNMTIERNVI